MRVAFVELQALCAESRGVRYDSYFLLHVAYRSSLMERSRDIIRVPILDLERSIIDGNGMFLGIPIEEIAPDIGLVEFLVRIVDLGRVLRLIFCKGDRVKYDDYVIKETIGEGYYGNVYKAKKKNHTASFSSPSRRRNSSSTPGNPCRGSVKSAVPNPSDLGIFAIKVLRKDPKSEGNKKLETQETSRLFRNFRREVIMQRCVLLPPISHCTFLSDF